VATVSGGDALSAKLRQMVGKLGSASEVRVGFLEGATYPDGTPVAEVAAIQNFGAPAANVPARPFFSNMVSQESPEWGRQFGQIMRDTELDAGKGLALMGEGIAGQLRQSIADTNEPPLAAATIARKGFDKPLVDTGHMLASVDKEVR
jgi:hypothetical protein